MLNSTPVRLEIFSPDLDTLTTDATENTITATDVEFAVTFFGSDGGSEVTGAALIDVIGTQVHYDILDGAGQFLDVDDDTGFNGYQLTFEALTGNNNFSIRKADIVGPRNKIQIEDSAVTNDKDSLLINVDGGLYTRGDDLTVQLGFKIKGTGRDDYLTGDDGRDLLKGRKGDDDLMGGAGDDKLIGNAGEDVLNGGAGDDLLKGGNGADSFILVAGGGTDTIKGFEEDRDILVVRTSAQGVDDLSVIQDGNNLLIESEGAIFSLKGVNEADLDTITFDFG